MCDSSCKRCECACYGIAPKVALNRARGQRGPQKRSTSPRSEREEREAAKRARINLSMATVQEDRLEKNI